MSTDGTQTSGVFQADVAAYAHRLPKLRPPLAEHVLESHYYVPPPHAHITPHDAYERMTFGDAPTQWPQHIRTIDHIIAPTPPPSVDTSLAHKETRIWIQ